MWNSKSVYIDGHLYESIFSASIDFEFSFSNLCKAIKKSDGAPVKYSGHTIVLTDWLEQHPEYEMKKGEQKK